MGPGNESFTHLSTNVKGTFGYFDPEYLLTRRLTTKSDVYSFGIVLLEVLTGRPALDKRLLEEQKCLVTWAVDFIREGEVDEIVDPGLAGQVSRTCLNEFVKIARRCLQRGPRKRPDMDHVVTCLELALVLQQKEEDGGVLDEETMSIDSGVCSSDGSIPLNDLSESLSRNNSNGATQTSNGAGQSLFSTTGSEDTRVNGENLPASNLKVYTYADLKAATRSFKPDMRLGQGSFGEVFKGWVDEKTLVPSRIWSGTIVAIKKTLMPSKIRSETIVAIKKSRDRHNFEKWQNHNVKISGFSFAKLGPSGENSHVSTRIVGTCGYIAPEYFTTGHLSVKSDMYGFGVVLLELLTGLRALDGMRTGEQEYLVEWKRPLLGKKETLKRIMDRRMEGQYSTEAALQASQLTLRCTELEPQNRPTMEEVVGILEEIQYL